MKTKIFFYLLIATCINISCVAHYNDKEKQSSENVYYINYKKVTPVFLNVIDSFIKTDHDKSSNIYIILFSRNDNIEFYISDVDREYGTANRTINQLIYKNKNIFFYTPLDALIEKDTVIGDKRADKNSRSWYVLMKIRTAINDAGISANKDFFVQRIDTTGNRIHFVKPVIK